MAIVHHGLVRMAHLAIACCHRVNGVSALHTKILKDRLFKDFDQYFPEKIINITNGVTPRRCWLPCSSKCPLRNGCRQTRLWN